MKQSVMMSKIVAGNPLFVVEFRKTETDSVRRKVQKAGEAATMPLVKHTVLLGDVSFELTEFLPDGADLAQVKAPFERGAKVIVHIETIEKTKWGNRINGSFQGLLEA